MNHLTETQLNDYLDGLLSASERTQVETHLTACPACREQLAALEHVFSLLSDLDEQPLTANLSTRVLEQLPAPLSLSRFERLSLAGLAGAILGTLAWLGQSLMLTAQPAAWLAQIVSLWAEVIGFVQIQIPSFTLPSINLPWSTNTILVMVIAATLLWVLGNVSLLRERLRVER